MKAALRGPKDGVKSSAEFQFSIFLNLSSLVSLNLNLGGNIKVWLVLSSDLIIEPFDL